MVPILIHLPPPSSDTEDGNVMCVRLCGKRRPRPQVLYNLIAGTATEGFKSKFYGQRHICSRNDLDR